MQVPGHRFVARHGLQRFHIPAMPEGHAVDGGQAAAEKFLPGGVDLCRLFRSAYGQPPQTYRRGTYY